MPNTYTTYEGYWDDLPVTDYYAIDFQGAYYLHFAVQTFTPQKSGYLYHWQLRMRLTGSDRSWFPSIMAYLSLVNPENKEPITESIFKAFDFHLPDGEDAYPPFPNEWMWLEHSHTPVWLEAGTMYAFWFIVQGGAFYNYKNEHGEWAARSGNPMSGGQAWTFHYDGYAPFPSPTMPLTKTSLPNIDFLVKFSMLIEGSAPVVAPPDLSDFPPYRPVDYDPDLIWTPDEWVDDEYTPSEWAEPAGIMVAAGGGRYSQNLVCVGMDLIYYEEFN